MNRVLKEKAPGGEDNDAHAEVQGRPARGRAPRRKRTARRAAFVLLVFVLLLPAAVLLALRAGIVGPVLEREAIAVVDRALPENLRASIEGTRVVIDGIDGLAVSLDGFRLTDNETGREVMRVGKARVGLRTSSAIIGAPQVESLSLSDAFLTVPPRSAGEAREWPEIRSLHDRLPALFAAVHKTVARTELDDTAMAIKLADVTIAAPGYGIGGLLIERAEMTGTGPERSMTAEAVLDGHAFGMEATLRGGGVSAVAEVKLTEFPLPLGRLRTMMSNESTDHQPGLQRPPVPADVAIAAYETPVGEPGALRLSVAPRDFSFKLGERDFLPLGGRFTFDWEAENDVLRLKETRFSLGRTRMQLSGAIRDVQGEEAAAGSYEFEILANEGFSDPVDSPESGVRFALRTLGEFHPEWQTVRFNTIDLFSSAGNAEGTGTLDFAAEIPSAIFAVAIENFAVAGVKQFWPAPVARGARRWVLANLAGGTVTQGKLVISEPLRRRVPGTREKLRGNTTVALAFEGVRFDVVGDIPPVREASGHMDFREGATKITLDSGITYLPSGRSAQAQSATLDIHRKDASGVVMADLTLDVTGEADAIGELVSYDPINAQSYRDYDPADLSGDVDAHVEMRFALNRRSGAPPPEWDVALEVDDVAMAKPFEGRMLSELSGSVEINRQRADIDVSGLVDGLPAEIRMIQPFGDSGVGKSRDIVLSLNDAQRDSLIPGLDPFIDGETAISLKGTEGQGPLAVTADLSSAKLSLPWLGWSKGSGIDAQSAFDLVIDDGATKIRNFKLDGRSFSADGDMTVEDGILQEARFGRIRLNDEDDVSVSVTRDGSGYGVAVEGQSFDARSLLRHLRAQLSSDDESDGVPVEIEARIANVTGFGGERFSDLDLYARHDGSDLQALEISAMTTTGFPVSMTLEGAGSARKIRISALDAGETLRFLDFYGQVRGGVLNASFSGRGGDVLAGTATVEDFRIFDEPRLRSLVATGNSGRSLNQAVQREIDTSEVRFDRASADIVISPSSLTVSKGAVRGPLVGSTFQGTVYDANDRMRMTGTFMPAYGLNSIFGEIPIFGAILGNGRDKALIGVTYKLEGDSRKPEVTVNPLSAIAPGVFRSIFEFR